MQATVIDPADVGALEAALKKHKVSGKRVVILFWKVSMYNLVTSWVILS